MVFFSFFNTLYFIDQLGQFIRGWQFPLCRNDSLLARISMLSCALYFLFSQFFFGAYFFPASVSMITLLSSSLFFVCFLHPQRAGPRESQAGLGGWRGRKIPECFPVCLGCQMVSPIRDCVFHPSKHDFLSVVPTRARLLTWPSSPNRHFPLSGSVYTPSSCVPLALKQQCFLLMSVSVFHHWPLPSFSAHPSLFPFVFFFFFWTWHS